MTIMDRHCTNVLVTGGAGFIGSNFIRYLFENTDFSGRVINADKLTYAGNVENLSDISSEYGDERYFFEHVDICDQEKISQVFRSYDIDTVVHLAAESHVDRSIHEPDAFIKTNIFGTFTLLETARNYWKDRNNVLFHHVSTDEVYGSLGDSDYFFETTAYDPRSPYSASKASSDHLVRSFFHTYNLPVTISNCSNNYGPYQFPEKLIPLMILNTLSGKKLPVYGDGKNIRDWIYVEDHASAIWTVIKHGKVGESYNVGGEYERENIVLIHELCEQIAELNDMPPDYYKNLISYVEDRPGHDRRYAMNCDKIKKELGWESKYPFEEGLKTTIKWYMQHPEWVENVVSGEYRMMMIIRNLISFFLNEFCMGMMPQCSTSFPLSATTAVCTIILRSSPNDLFRR